MTQLQRGFWARRQAAVKAEEQAEIDAALKLKTEAEQAELEARDDAEILAELDLPDPDTLQLGDDIRAFMARTVPERLRRRAMRRLWTTNPVLACLDGLNDYDDDYTLVSSEPVRTTYQVGKGLLAHVQELARQAETKTAPQDEAAEADQPEPGPEPEDTPESQPEHQPETLAVAEAETTDETETFVAVSPRRMRFDFAT